MQLLNKKQILELFDDSILESLDECLIFKTDRTEGEWISEIEAMNLNNEPCKIIAFYHLDKTSEKEVLEMTSGYESSAFDWKSHLNGYFWVKIEKFTKELEG